MMEKEFIPYELALGLKQLGFNEPCLGYSNTYFKGYIISYPIRGCVNSALLDQEVAMPLWQQAFDWFREKHNLFIPIQRCKGTLINGLTEYSFTITDSPWDRVPTYQKARQDCLEKLIEICKTEKK